MVFTSFILLPPSLFPSPPFLGWTLKVLEKQKRGAWRLKADSLPRMLPARIFEAKREERDSRPKGNPLNFSTLTNSILGRSGTGL